MPARSGEDAASGVSHTAALATTAELGVPLPPPVTTWKKRRERVAPAGTVTSKVAIAPCVPADANTAVDTELGVTSTAPGPKNTLVLTMSPPAVGSSAVTSHRSAVVKPVSPLLVPAIVVVVSLPKFEAYATVVEMSAAVGFSSVTSTRAVSPPENTRYVSVTCSPPIVCVDGVTTVSPPLGLTSTVPSSSATTVFPTHTTAPQSNASPPPGPFASRMPSPGLPFEVPPVGRPLLVPHAFDICHS